MTAVEIRAAQAEAPSLAARARDVVAFEWTKLRSVRSHYITLLIAAVVTIGASAIVAHAIGSVPNSPPTGFSALTASFLAYAEYAVIPVSVLAVLQFTSEYSTGSIRTTFAAVPRRWTVLAGKAAVVGTAALVTGEVLAFACFSMVQAILSGRHRGVSLAQPGVPGAVLAAGFVLCSCALTALGLAAIIRHIAGAITATLAVIYLVAGLCLFLPSPWKDDIGRFTMAFAASQVVGLHPQTGLFSPWASMLVLAAWPAGVLLAAGLVISRRDA
jgi:ABC-type transport system involved in multi-copper enzyme maturation permease subunit